MKVRDLKIGQHVGIIGGTEARTKDGIVIIPRGNPGGRVVNRWIRDRQVLVRIPGMVRPVTLDVDRLKESGEQ